MYYQDPSITELDQLREQLVQALLKDNTSLTEGTVMSMGPPPYRRIDCGGRAVAYLRSRPRKRAVRADISGLWVICPQARARAAKIIIRSATGGASLMITSAEEIDTAVDLISSSVRHTLRLEAEYVSSGVYSSAA